MVAQLHAAGQRVVHLGDDTWHSLFPGLFEPNLTHAYDSFNVWDLHTVDNGVNEHLLPLLQPENTDKWDVIFGHYLGVDHAGHRYGPDHPAMAAKLKQMDETVREMIELLDDDTLLVIMGDHGMDSKGDHGGESEDEVQAALWMYSKRGAFGRTPEAGLSPPATAKERPVNQIDLVPTLSLLLGLPIPFNNLGTPIEEAFVGTDGDDVANLALVNRLTAAQIHRYQQEYALVSKPDPASTAQLDAMWHAAEEAWDASIGMLVTSQRWKHVSSSFAEYQMTNLAICKALWAQFDLLSMAAGVIVLLGTLVLMAVFARGLQDDTAAMRMSLVTSGVWSMFQGGSAGFIVSGFLPAVGRVRASLFLAAMSCILTWSYSLLMSPSRIPPLSIPTNVWSYALITFVLLQSAGFGSNSFTIWEDEILLFFLGTAAIMLLAQSVRLRGAEDRRRGIWHSIIFLGTIRLASMSRLCREEQMPWGQSTYYASATSSTSAPWQLAISWLVALFLPSIIKAYFTMTQSYHGSLPLWLGVAFRICLLLISIFWTLDAADDGDWLIGIEKETLKSIRMCIAQFVLCIAFGAGTATYAYMSPCIGITTRTAVAESKNTKGAPEPVWEVQRKPQIIVQGTRNLYGSHFAVLPLTVILIPLILVQKPMGQGVLALMVIAIFSLLEVLHLLQEDPISSPSPPAAQISPNKGARISAAIGPVLLALLGHFTFFKTGHQATLASIQWDSAFIPLRTIRYPWSPFLVVLNTFAGPILCAAAVPTIVLWRRPYSFSPTGSRGEGTDGDSVFSPPATSKIGGPLHLPNSNADKGSTISGSKEAHADHRERERDNLLTALAKAHLTHILVYAAYNIATTILAGHLRRHLMLYRVFCPRWMVGSALLVLAELMGAVFGVGGVRWTIGALAGLFGW
jgi:phosphatidylinositol glycan class O